MVGVKREELTQMQAAELLGLSCRQTKRVWRRYPAEGDAGLVPRLRGRPSLRRQPPALRAQMLGWYEDERYADFGPTLLAEPLAPAGLVVDHETLRRWLLATGKWTVEVSSILRRGLSGVERKHGRTTKKGDILS
jgi:hypothetical protein